MVRSRVATVAPAEDEADRAASPSAPDGGVDALPWLAEPLAQALRTQRGHALLVHADAGIGALAFALAFAQGLLCEAGDLAGRTRQGKAFLTLDEGDTLLRPALRGAADDRLLCLSAQGRALVFAAEDVLENVLG